MKRAFIHIGMPKTGSTAVQTMLGEERDLLARYGLTHPDTRDSNRLGIIAHCYAGDIGRRYLKNRNITRDEALSLAAELWRQVKLAEGDIVLSCEQLHRGDEFAETIVRDISNAGFEPVIVCYFRHPVDASISAAQQLTKMGRGTLEENISSLYWPRCKENISHYLATGAKIIPRSFDDAKARGVPKDFLRAIGYAHVADEVREYTSNESLSMDGALIAEVFWRYKKKHGVPPFPRPLLAKIDGPKFVTPKEARDSVRKMAQSDVDWVSDTFGIELAESQNDGEFYDRPRPEALSELLHLIQQNNTR